MADLSANQTSPAADVAAWRRARLIRAGFDERTAVELSLELALDLHALLQLVDRGCPPELAARIVAPLNRPSGSSRQ